MNPQLSNYLDYNEFINRWTNINMTIITIECHNTEYGTSQKAYMAEYIDWPKILKTMNDNDKYVIHTIEVK